MPNGDTTQLTLRVPVRLVQQAERVARAAATVPELRHTSVLLGPPSRHAVLLAAIDLGLERMVAMFDPPAPTPPPAAGAPNPGPDSPTPDADAADPR